MGPKLTRACHECIRAKRRCSQDTPRCTRCRTRRSECRYENEPLTRHDDSIVPGRLCQEVGVGAIEQNLFRRADTLYISTPDERSFSFMKNLAKRHPISFCRTGRTIFLHRQKTQTSSFWARLQATFSAIVDDEGDDDWSFSQEHAEPRILPSQHLAKLNMVIGELIASTPTLTDYLSKLAFVQGLVLVQSLTLFMIPHHILPATMIVQADNRQRLLDYWSRKLWDLAPDVLPIGLSTHQAYSIAESVRRTLIVANEILCLWHVCKYGYFSPSLFTRSLPFDRRMALWDLSGAEFEQTSLSLSGWVQLDQCQQQADQIVSYHEFVGMFDSGEIGSVCGAFDAMLLVGARGIDAVESRCRTFLT